jgi:hypothetical protein
MQVINGIGLALLERAQERVEGKRSHTGAS